MYLRQLSLVLTLLGALSGLSFIAPPANGASVSPRVINGDEVSPALYTERWQSIVALVNKDYPALDGQFCAGTLIAPTLVLTAAHCVQSPYDGSLAALQANMAQVMTGVRNLADTSAGERINIANVYVHPGYNANTAQNDLAVIRLASPSAKQTSPYVSAGDEALWSGGSFAWVAGWGSVSYITSRYPDRLFEAELPIKDDGICSTVYGIEFDKQSMLCAGILDTLPGLENNGVDTCYGDSGGPLLISPAPGSYKLAGITSWGDACASKEKYGVYTRLGSYTAWLDSISPTAGGPGGILSPRALTLTRKGSTSARIGWTQPASGAPTGGYAISNVKEETLFPIAKTSEAGYLIPKLEPSTSYALLVQGVAADGSKGDVSNVIRFTTKQDYTIPTRPGRPWALKRGYKSIVLKWRRSQDNYMMSYYIVQRRVAGGWKRVGFSNGPAVAARRLKPHTPYRFRIIAVDANGNKSRPSPSFLVSTK